MRKRSEVRQQTLDTAAPAQAPSAQTPTQTAPPATTRPAGIEFYKCKCGLKQARGVYETNDGKCLRCGEKVDLSRAPDEVAPLPNGVKAPAPNENGDPWQLRPDSKKESAPAEPAQPARAPETPQSAPPGQPFGADAVPITTLIKMLEKAGYVVALLDAAQWTPLQRTVAHAWVISDGESPPEFLERYRATQAPAAEPAPEQTQTRTRTRSGKAKDEPRETAEETLARPDVREQIGRRADIDARMPGGVETVSYTWGEEKITPVKNSFSTVTVGPITMTTTVRQEETHAEAVARLRRMCESQAEQERAAKIASFLKKLREVAEDVKRTDAQANAS